MRLTKKEKIQELATLKKHKVLMTDDDYKELKLGHLEDIEEWFSKKVFYGTALNEPNKILELRFEKLDFRVEEGLLLIHFKVLNSWSTSIFYNIFQYGKSFALTKEELL